MPKGVENELGLSGLSRTRDGYVTEEFLPALRTHRQAAKVWKEMSYNDPVVGAFLFAIDMLVRQVTWRVEANPMADEGKGQDDEIQFLRECMDDMSHTWSDFISEVMTMIVYGWSAFEVVYKQRSGPQKEGAKVEPSNYSDGKIGWRKFSIRAQDTLYKWEFSDDGSVVKMMQQAPPMNAIVEIPVEKLILFRTTVAKNNPEGRSVLRNAYRPWYFKQKIEEIEAIGIERDLAGLPIASVPASMLLPSATDEEKATLNAIRSIVQNIKRDKEEGVVWPSDHDPVTGQPLFDLRLLSSGGSRTFDTNSIVERYDRRIATTVMADFIFLGQQAGGSFALSSDKTSLFAVALGAWLQMIEGVINQFAVKRLFEVNGMDSANPPLIKHGDVEKPDLTLLSGYLSTLAGIGMTLFPDEDLEQYLRDIASLPQPSPETKQALEDARAQQQQMMMGGAPPAGGDQQQPQDGGSGDGGGEDGGDGDLLSLFG